MKTVEQEVVELGHTIDATRPVWERIRIYRALATTTASAAIAAHFFACADELAAAEEQVGQRTLSFGKSDKN